MIDGFVNFGIPDLVGFTARSESLDSLTLEGPLGRATLGLRPAALVRVLRGDADPALFHRVPTAAVASAGDRDATAS